MECSTISWNLSHGPGGRGPALSLYRRENRGSDSMAPASQDARVLIPRTCDCVTSHGKGGIKIADGIKPANRLTLKQKDSLGYPGGPGVTTRGLRHGRGRQEKRQRQTGLGSRSEGCHTAAFEMEEGTMGPGMWAASRGWKGQGNGLSSGASRRHTALIR